MSSSRGKSGLSGVRKVAILVAALGEEAAAVIYRQLPPADVQQITAEVANLDSVPPAVAQQILEEYLQQSAAQKTVIQGGADYATRLLQKAFGEESAKELVQKAAEARTHEGNLGWLRGADPKKLTAFLEREHSQMKALVLAQL